MSRMTIRGVLLAASILLASGAAEAVPLPHFISNDYGTFLGTWSGNIPQGQGGGGDAYEDLISERYSAPTVPADIEPFASLGDIDPNDPAANQLNLVGKVESPSGTKSAGRLEVTVTTEDGSDKTGGTWKYLSDNDPNAPPGNEPVDFYLVVKWAREFSIFYYPSVEPNDTGLWSTSAFVLGLPICGAEPPGGFVGADCIPMNTGPATPKARGVSHIEAYWPPIRAAETPEPAALGLLGVSLVGLALLRRRNRV